MSEIIKPGIRLFIICVISVFLLSIVSEVTKEPIAAQKRAVEQNALKAILPNAKNFKDKQQIQEGNIYSITEAVDENNSVVGYAIGVMPKGYGGSIDLVVGISNDGIIQGINILSHLETAGLGAKASDPEFTNQYIGKKIDKDIKVVKSNVSNDNEVQAITAATITSNAVTSGVNEVINYFKTSLEGK